MREHTRELLELFFADVRPISDPCLVLVLEFAGLATIGRKYLSYILFFPKLLKSLEEHVPLDDPRDENVPPE